MHVKQPVLTRLLFVLLPLPAFSASLFAPGVIIIWFSGDTRDHRVKNLHVRDIRQVPHLVKYYNGGNQETCNPCWTHQLSLTKEVWTESTTSWNFSGQMDDNRHERCCRRSHPGAEWGPTRRTDAPLASRMPRLSHVQYASSAP